MKNGLKRIRAIWHTDLETKLENNAFLLHNIYDMYFNTMLVNQGINWEELAEYKFSRELHSILRVYSVSDGDRYERIGRNNDGGYVMRIPLSGKNIAYSFGISNDVSWDSGMAERGYDVYMYDHTINKLPYDCAKFHWEKIGISGENKIDVMTMEEILARNGHTKENGMVLKMDVEGAEWDFLRTVSGTVLEQFDQIVLELHDLGNPQKRKDILEGIEKLCASHNCIHIHGNNSGRVFYCERYITPETLEVTFLKKSIGSFELDNGMFPKEIDQPGVAWISDVKLGRWNN